MEKVKSIEFKTLRYYLEAIRFLKTNKIKFLEEELNLVLFLLEKDYKNVIEKINF
jgi:hypothetical protein